MADFEENPFAAEQTDVTDYGGEIPMEPLDDQPTELLDGSTLDQPPEHLSAQQIALRDTVIDDLHKEFPGYKHSEFLSEKLIRKNGLWYYKSGSNEVRLSNKNGVKFLAKSVITRQKGGREFFKELNDTPLQTRVTLEPTVVLRQRVENIEMDIINNDDMQLQEDMETVIEDLSNPLTPDDRRELRGAASTLVTTSSRVKSATVNVEWVSREREKAEGELKDATDEQDIKYWEGEVERFKTQEILYKGVRGTLQRDERTQTERIKDILNDKRRPLGDRIRELFKKEGITIASLAAAVGMTITAIALGIANAFKKVIPTPTPGPTPGPPKPNIPDKIRDVLKKFGRFLLDLAKKGAAALPGLIGTIVSFILKTAGQAVGFLAEHLVLGLIAIVVIVFEVIMKRVKK